MWIQKVLLLKNTRMIILILYRWKSHDFPYCSLSADTEQPAEILWKIQISTLKWKCIHSCLKSLLWIQSEKIFVNGGIRRPSFLDEIKSQIVLRTFERNNHERTHCNELVSSKVEILRGRRNHPKNNLEIRDDRSCETHVDELIHMVKQLEKIKPQTNWTHTKSSDWISANLSVWNV